MEKRERFEELFNESFGILVIYAKKLTWGKPEDARDLLQDTMEMAYRKLDKYSSDKGKFSTWAAKIMHNLFIDKVRKERRMGFVEYEELFGEEGSIMNIFSDNSHERIFDSMHLQDVMKCIDQLPAKNKKPLLMVMEGYKMKEISEILNTPGNTIRPYIHDARKYLKKIIKNNP